MRSVFQPAVSMLIAAVILAVIGISFLTAPNLALWAYPLARQAVYLKIDYSTQKMLVKETDHFIIKYTPVDSQTVDMVALAAEAAYEPVGKMLNYRPSKKSLIIVYKDRASMHDAYGWSRDESAMGFYWGGVIQVLSPAAWLNNKKSAHEFVKTGPMAHEYTHLALDHLVRGNYSRWFTEGLAQYVEYKVNGYEWISENNCLSQAGYTMAELDKKFDELPNQALAYRQSLAIVRYIIETYGEDCFSQILLDMKDGCKTEKAIKKAIGLNYFEIETKVNFWAKENMASRLIS